MKGDTKNYFKSGTKFLKFFLGLFFCLLVRLIPFRAPNIEPIMATVMPFSKYFNAYTTFSFAVLSILIYDLLTNTLGVHTMFTAGAYGAVALFSYYYFKKHEPDKWHFMKVAVIGTLFFDAATGLSIGPIFSNQPFSQALFGQIPFTLYHLLGNITFALILSPAIYKYLIRKKETKEIQIIKILNPKTI